MTACSESATHSSQPRHRASRSLWDDCLFAPKMPVQTGRPELPGARTTPLRRKKGRGRKIGHMRPRKVILCVDDNEQTLAVRKFLLETRGYRVICCSSAAEALEVLERAVPNSIDLLLCDLIMPQMDGTELVRRAKEMCPGLPTLIVSGTVSAFERGSVADAFLPKGASSPVELLERVRLLVARKRGPKKAVIAPSFSDVPRRGLPGFEGAPGGQGASTAYVSPMR